MVGTKWVYSLRREDLIAYATEFGLTADGTVEELRKRMAEFIKGGEHKPEVEERLEELQQKHLRAVSPSHREEAPGSGANNLQLSTNPGVLPNITINNLDNDISMEAQRGYLHVVEQVRKWSFKYDGSKEPLAFLERVEELADVYQIPIDQVPKTMPELLKDMALSWFRNNNRRWESWQCFKQDFLEFFLPSGYFAKLEDNIRSRKQQTGESFKAYMVALQDLMRQAGYSEERKLERLYENANPKYKLYIKRRDFRNLRELLELAGDYEDVSKESAVFQPAPRIPVTSQRPIPRPRSQPQPANKSSLDNTSTAAVAVTGGSQHGNQAEAKTINPRTACRRCGEDGHMAFRCKNAVKAFCWNCGRVGVKTFECCRKSAGNATGLHQ